MNLAMILMVGSIFFAENNFQLLDMYYTNSEGEKGVTTYDYGQNGNIRMALWHLEDGSRSSLNRYEYNDENALTAIHRTFSDGMSSEKKLYYDEEGRLIRETFSRSDGKTGDTHYAYNKQGQQQTAICKGLNGWFFGDIVYHYLQDGKKHSATMVRDKKEIGKIQYSYNEQGELDKETWQIGPDFSQTFSYSYESNPEGGIHSYTSSNVFLGESPAFSIEKETYKFSDGTEGPSFFRYDSTGKLLVKTYERSDGVQTETHYFYRADGRLYKSYRMFGKGGAAVFEYTFDNERHLVDRQFKKSDGTKGSEHYVYQDGKLISGDLDNFDSWITGHLDFDSRNGRLESAKFIGKGDQSFDALLHFTFNAKGGLTKLVWNFSFGKSQTYTYHYKDVSASSPK